MSPCCETHPVQRNHSFRLLQYRSRRFQVGLCQDRAGKSSLDLQLHQADPVLVCQPLRLHSLPGRLGAQLPAPPPLNFIVKSEGNLLGAEEGARIRANGEVFRLQADSGIQPLACGHRIPFERLNLVLRGRQRWVSADRQANGILQSQAGGNIRLLRLDAEMRLEQLQGKVTLACASRGLAYTNSPIKKSAIRTAL